MVFCKLGICYRFISCVSLKGEKGRQKKALNAWSFICYVIKTLPFQGDTSMILC